MKYYYYYNAFPMPSSFIRVLLFLIGIFLVTILATPSSQIDVGVSVTNRTEAIRQGLIHALSTTTSTIDFGKVFHDNVPSIKQDRNSRRSTEYKMPMPTLLELGQKFTLGADGKRQFEFTAYGMQAFSKLADLWNLPMQQLITSLRMGELHQISNPNGRLSNMDIFIKTVDQQFFIKDVKTGMETLKNKQRKALKKIRPRAEIDFFEKHFWAYFARMEEEFEMEHQQSLLPKYFAFFGIKDNSYGVPGEERFFLLTKNLFPEKYKDEKNSGKNEQQQQFALDFTYKFDVKGSLDHQKLSAKKRNASKHPMFRYLDLYDENEQQMSADERKKIEVTKEGCFFRNGIMLEDETYEKFIGILGRDALFLKETGKTDYSLLMGITFDKLNETQMKLLKNENSNILMASCKNCSANRGETYSTRIDKFIIIPGIIDALAQFNWRKIIDLVNRTVVKHDTEKKAKSAIDPTDYYYRFMCAISTKVFRPQHNSASQIEANAAKFCTWKITEPSL